MRRFRAIAAVLMLVLMVPLARAGALTSSAAVAQRECCKQKADLCCQGSSKACCVTHVPADTGLFPAREVSQLLLPPLAVPLIHTDHIDSLNVQCAARKMPAEHSPPGLVLVATTILRI